MISVLVDKEVTLKFNINVEGNKTLPEARLILNLDSGVSLAIKGKIEEKIAKVVLPPLKYILKETGTKIVSSYLEVIADNTYHIPWKDSCELKESMQISVNESVNIEEKNESVVIEANIEPTPEPVKKLFKESATKKVLSEKWKLYSEKSKKSIFESGYLQAINDTIDYTKKALATLTEEEVYNYIKIKLKEAVSLQESAGNIKDKVEFSNGYYSAVFDTLMSFK